MASAHSFAFKSPIPVYAVALPRSDVLLYAGGGGQSRSGIANAIRSVTIDADHDKLQDEAQIKLSSQEDAPMCIAITPSVPQRESADASAAGAKESAEQASQCNIVVGINAEVDASGSNDNLRLFQWQKAQANDSANADGEARPTTTHRIDSLAKAPSVRISDAEVYIKRTVVSPNGKLLAVGSTDGQLALHAFPSLEPIWSTSSSHVDASTEQGSKAATADVVDITFSADSALVAFVTPSAILVFATATPSASSSKIPELYQTIRNPTLKGTTGCVFRAARFGRNAQGAKDVNVSRLYTIVNTNPPAGLGSSKRDREKAKIRKCFVSVWNVDQWALLQTRQISDRPATVADLSENGRFIAISTSDLQIHLLSAQTLKTIWRIRDAHAFPGTCLAFSPQSDVLVSGSADMSLRVAQVDGRKEGATASGLLEGKLVTIVLALLLALLAWYLQEYLKPATPSITVPSAVPAPSVLEAPELGGTL